MSRSMPLDCCRPLFGRPLFRGVTVYKRLEDGTHDIHIIAIIAKC